MQLYGKGNMSEKILGAEVPYVEMFGVDGMTPGRPSTDSEAYRLSLGRGRMEPVQPEHVGGSLTVARTLTRQARRRATAVIVRLHWDELVRVYRKEKDHLVARHRIGAGLDSVGAVGAGDGTGEREEHGA